MSSLIQNRVKKIGVITFAFTLDNYGQILQYLATQEYLRSLGYEVSLVQPEGNRNTKTRRTIKKINRYWSKICKRFFRGTESQKSKKISEVSDIEIQKNKVFAQWAEVTSRQEKEHPRHFEEFRKNFFSQQHGTFEDIIESGYDAFCVGSDQTWSGAGYYWMLGWTPRKSKRFSIAPSVGHRSYTDNEIKGFVPLLKRFDFITVREDNGLKLCSRCGRDDAHKVLDPTFLVEPLTYKRFVERVNKPSHYIFIYLLGGEISESVKNIISFCHGKGYEVVYVESQGREEFVPKVYATVGQWIDLISEADYVVTNSFHGVAFACIFRKPFLVFPLIGLMEGMNGRIFDITQQFNLKDRIYKGEMSMLFEPMDWSMVESKIRDNKTCLDTLVMSL